ncbi:MAG: fimbria/pilus outer membrane usher protein [Pseudomonadota bacterium]
MTDALPTPPLSSTPASTDDHIVPFDVTVNGADEGTWLFVERDEALYATVDAFEEWRVVIDETIEPIVFRGTNYFPLTAIPGFELTVDYSNQAVDLQFAPESFAATTLTNDAIARPVLNTVLPSVFANYDLNYSSSYQADQTTPQDLSALVEFGFSTGLGVLTNSMIGRNLANNDVLSKGREFKRLETTFTRDFTEHNLTLRLGDAYTKESMLDRSVYFGGISIGTNFRLTPGFVSQPLPVITGMSAAPSTVELYVNDVLRQVSNIPTGPFAIDNFPTLSGSGNARIVVRDQLGRETVVERSFVNNSQLLAPGLKDWSLEAGKIRNEIGSVGSNYDPRFVSGYLRRGIKDSLTLEGHAGVTPEQANIGFGLVSALPIVTLGRTAVNFSTHQKLGSGQQLLLGIEYQSLRSSAVFEVQGATRSYRQVGQMEAFIPTRLQVAGSFNYGSEKLGSFGLGLARIARYDERPTTTMTASYTRRIGKKSSLSFVASKATSGRNSTSSFTLNLVIPFGKNRMASSSASTRGGDNDLYQSVSQNASTDSNLSWRALAGQKLGNNRAEAGAYYFGRYGNFSSDVSNFNEKTSVRLGAASSFVFTDGHLFATRKLEDSFAIAEVEGYDNVGVGIGSNVLTKTNKKGVALIPRLMPYQNNAIRIDPRELPLSAGIDSIEQVAVPAYRSAVKIIFPVRTGRGALLRVVLDDGDVAPAGALVSIEGETEEFYVARRGEAFVTGLQDHSHLVLKWLDQQCTFDIELPPELPDEISRVGPFVCHGVKR